MSLFYNPKGSMSAIMRYMDEVERHAPCPEGLAALRECRNRKRAFELAVSPVAVDFFVRSICEGWGPSPEEVETVFRPYLNGGMTVRHDLGDRTVSAQMWCMSDYVSVSESVRWAVLIGCRGVVEVKRWQVVKIICDSSTDIEIDCDDTSVVLVENYGGRVAARNGKARIMNRI